MSELINYLVRRFRRSERGAALVELAIIAPVLLLLVTGIVELGWYFNGYITITGAAREGARVAAVGGDFQQAINDHINSLPRLNVNSTRSGGENQFDDVTVTVAGDITPLFVSWELPLKASATMRRQYADE